MESKMLYNKLKDSHVNEDIFNDFLAMNKNVIFESIGSIYKEMILNNHNKMLLDLTVFVVKKTNRKENLATKRISEDLSLIEQELLLKKVGNCITNNDELSLRDKELLKTFNYHLSTNVFDYFNKSSAKKIDYMLKNNNKISDNFVNILLDSIVRDKNHIDYIDFYLIVDFLYENKIGKSEKYNDTINKLKLNDKFSIELKNFIIDKISATTNNYIYLITDNNFKEMTTEKANKILDKIKSFSKTINLPLETINYSIKNEIKKMKSNLILNETKNHYLVSIYDKLHNKIDKKLFFMTHISNKIDSELNKKIKNNKY